ncbi:PLP-dependent aminotransferase family protein [Streptomyces sp. NPDC089799]|uniref:MocR-like pyridoxine biosynthesis transcription factor PdxR n=1 Tax=Streptomyces sp. NPDC089799 TaxID=3155066 RepID=UPI00341DB1E9
MTRDGSDLHLELPPEGPRRPALVRALREAVRSGRLAGGTRLPPYRALAADLGIARGAVADAYAELVAEGWLTARQGSGTRVPEGLARAEGMGEGMGEGAGKSAARAEGPADGMARAAGPAPAASPARFDLAQGKPDPAAFPRTAWAASARRAVLAAPSDAFGPGDPRGRPELRRALASYLARARGVRADPDRVVVCSGFANALRLLAAVRPRDWAVEGYGLPFHHGILDAAGIRPHPVPVDDDGARTDLRDVLASPVRTLLLTPAHQFPTGATLHPSRRAAAVEWARSHPGALVVEDDYDGEFRYDRKPVGALQGLAPGHVVYAGSLSKSLSPAIRLGWLVLPDGVRDEVLAAKGVRESWAGAPDQLALADFLECGAYDRQVRRMRQRYRDRRDRLVAALAAGAPEVRVTGIAAGLHAVLELPPGTEPAALEAARAAGIALDGLSGYRHPAHPATSAGTVREGLVVGYAALPDRAFTEALAALVRVVAEVTRAT